MTFYVRLIICLISFNDLAFDIALLIFFGLGKESDRYSN